MGHFIFHWKYPSSSLSTAAFLHKSHSHTVIIRFDFVHNEHWLCVVRRCWCYSNIHIAGFLTAQRMRMKVDTSTWLRVFARHFFYIFCALMYVCVAYVLGRVCVKFHLEGCSHWSIQKATRREKCYNSLYLWKTNSGHANIYIQMGWIDIFS